MKLRIKPHTEAGKLDIMLRRILAWILLIGFVALFIDIAYIGFMRPLFATVYVVVAIGFFVYSIRNRQS